jgi:hypothetical protein
MQNTHLTHIEDLLLIDGKKAVPTIIDYFRYIILWLQGDRNQISIRAKYDGSPATTFGKHPENSKFFISTKSLLNKKHVRYAHTVADIQKEFTPAIHSILEDTFHALAGHHHDSIWQGDIMFTQATLRESKKYYEFCHNTILYQVKKNSVMGEHIRNAQVGLAIHTQYHWESGEYYATLGKEPPTINGIWQPPLEPFLQVRIRRYNLMKIHSALSGLELHATHISDLYALIEQYFPNPKKWKEEIMKTINRRIRENVSVTNATQLWRDIHSTMWSHYIQQASFDKDNPDNNCNKLDAFEKKHGRDIERWFRWYADAVRLKHSIITILRDLVDDSELSMEINGKKTNHEGFVVSQQDKWAIKLVNRHEFSHVNFVKNFDRKKQKI